MKDGLETASSQFMKSGVFVLLVSAIIFLSAFLLSMATGYQNDIMPIVGGVSALLGVAGLLLFAIGALLSLIADWRD